MIDLKAEPSYKTLYEMENEENKQLKIQNMKLNERVRTLVQMLKQLDKERKYTEVRELFGN